MTEVLFRTAEWFLIAVSFSYYVDLHFDTWNMADLINFLTWNTMLETFIAPVLVVCPYSCCWCWSVDSGVLCLKSLSLPIAVSCSRYLDQLCRRWHISNLMRFWNYWKTSRNIFIVIVLVISFWRYWWSCSFVSLWTCSTEMLLLASKRLSWKKIVCPQMGTISNQVYFSILKTLSKIFIAPVSMIHILIYCWSWSVVPSYASVTKMPSLTKGFR